MTAVAPERHRPAEPSALPLLPDEPRRAGPVTRRLLARTAAVLAALQVGALALLAAGGSTAEVVGSSMIIPGGGLLHSGRPLLYHRITGRPQVTRDRPSVALRGARR